MRVLGIETSCDDTGVAIYDGEAGLLAHCLATQVELHKPYGGVVPELAARDHIKTLLPLIDHLICDPRNGGPRNGVKPDAIAYTAGPGLAGALLVGASVGESLARAWGIPALGIHHMEGHLLAPMLEPDPPAAPMLALLVSGGHTMLVDVEAVGVYRILGQSLDDAAGEAFDKTAKLLGLDQAPGLAGGPAVAAAALGGRPGRFSLPRPMTTGNHRGAGLDFSFSGLKTQVRITAGRHQLDPQTIADLALAFEVAVVETLVIKCRRALRQTGRKRLVVSGGVGANERLRRRLRQAALDAGVEVFYPRPELCTDNGAMIAYAGYCRLAMAQSGHSRSNDPGDPNAPNAPNDNGGAFDVRPRWSLADV